ncbi:DUF4358 domain-containing protein [Clostridium sp. BJN0001]|uniref:DUF4358 domain-containing protein n=1 Tax=Clostridium sp. BJN0001 TaxID=2930219 RepID=UPI001FD3550B|nr:DUF4358 domain-containing protein [Clostridium sp. BJN0001]
MKKKKKKYTNLYAVLTLTVVFCFVLLYQVVKVKNVDIGVLNQNVQNNTDVSLMDSGDFSKLRKLYNIDKKEIQSFVLYAPKSNMQANEILIIKPEKKEDFASVESKIKSRIEKQTKSFENYSKDQSEIMSKHILEEKGDYIILIVSPDVTQIKKAINSNF